MYKLASDNLIIPIYDIKGKLWNLQIIFPDGRKRFLKGGKKKGCFTVIGRSFRDSDKIFIAEGFATAASIYLATNIPCIVAFDAYNIEPVLKEISHKYPKKKYIICADYDAYGKRNIGEEYALKAAYKYNAKVLFPKFRNIDTKPTDFNDLHVLEGLEEVKRQLLNEGKL